MSDPKNVIFKESECLEGIFIEGPDFDKDIDLKAVLTDYYEKIGFQATHLGKAVKIWKKN
jgi:deoxyhypusine synthase